MSSFVELLRRKAAPTLDVGRNLCMTREHMLPIREFFLSVTDNRWDEVVPAEVPSVCRTKSHLFKVYKSVLHRPDNVNSDPATQKYVTLGVWPLADAILPAASGNVKQI